MAEAINDNVADYKIASYYERDKLYVVLECV